MSSLYDFPHIYDVLASPGTEEIAQLDRWLARYHQGSLQQVLDPACGPGGYLLPLAHRGIGVWGNDLNREAVDFARARLPEGRWTCADMLALPEPSPLLDLVLMLNSSTGHLPDSEALLDFLHHTRQRMRSGALLLLAVTLLPQAVEREALELYNSGWQDVANGRARVCYVSTERHGVLQREAIEVRFASQGLAGVPASFVERYTLCTWRLETLHTYMDSAGFDLVGIESAFADETKTLSERNAEGDVVLAMRAR